MLRMRKKLLRTHEQTSTKWEVQFIILKGFQVSLNSSPPSYFPKGVQYHAKSPIIFKFQRNKKNVINLNFPVLFLFG